MTKSKKILFVYYKLSQVQGPFLVISRKCDEIVISYDTGKTSVNGKVFEQIFWSLNGKNETQLIDFIQLLIAREIPHDDIISSIIEPIGISTVESIERTCPYIFIGTNFGFSDTQYEFTNSLITTKLMRVIINSFSNDIGIPHNRIISHGTF